MSQPSSLQIDLKTRTVVLRAAVLARGNAWEGASELMGRLLSAPCVQSVAIDRARGTATMRLVPVTELPTTALDGSDELRMIANCLRQTTPPQQTVAAGYAQCKTLEIRKNDAGITGGVIFHALPGRVRLRHPLLIKNADLAVRIEAALGATAGVQSVSASAPTGSILVLYQQGTTTPNKLLAKLERIVNGQDDNDALLAGPPASYWLAAGTCLGLAVATDFFVPGLATATAAALVGFNLPTLGRGAVELATFQWRMPALYTVIMGTTLATGNFLPAAIMQASVTSWHCWSSYRLRKVVRELTLDQDLPDGFLINSATDDASQPAAAGFAPGMIVNVPVGVALPFDGIVVEGEGEFEEHRVRGVEGTAVRGAGEHVYAGSELIKGQVKVEVVAVESATRLATIRRTVRSVIGKTAGTGGPTKRGKALASRFVPFTFATGTAAFLIGGLPTLAAVLRPDFATGPSLTERFGTLSGVSHLLHEGWLVNNPEALYELDQIKTIVIAHRAHDDSAAAELQVIHTPLTVYSRTVDVHEIAGSEDDCLEYIDELTATGKRIAVVACHQILSQFMDDEVIRISLTPEAGIGPQHADLIALHSEPQRLESLLRIVHETSAPGRNAWSVVLACNTLAISGAFLVGLTSLHVVMLTNIGALAAGAMYGRHMRRSRRLLAARRVTSRPVTHEILLPSPDEDTTEDETTAVIADRPTGPFVIGNTVIQTSDTLDDPEAAVEEQQPSKPGLRRAAHRRDARLKHEAAKLMALTNEHLDQNHTP